MAKRAAGDSQVSIDTIYAAVAARRTQWDALLWQVPALALAAQGILLTSVFAPDTRHWPRVVAAAIAVLVGLLSLQLFLRHRHTELFDAGWLAEQDKRSGYPGIHGKRWAEERNQMNVEVRVFGWLMKRRSTNIWRWGLVLILLVDIASLVVAVGWDWVFTGTTAGLATS